MKFNVCALLLLFFSTSAFAQSYKGDVTGFVMDAKTQEPLAVVNVQIVEKPGFGTVTDVSGAFSIKGIDVGSYSLKATLVGYESIILTNIVVSTGRSTKVTFKLNEQAVQIGGVTVNATYFSRNNELSPLSVNNYDRAEVKRQPGSAMDVQRVVQNLPGIASSNDNMNELIVRGGAPFENLTVMEYMEIPSISHYPNQFNSAGPINMVNIDLVEDVQFSSGGFPAQYGDKISSIMDLKIREGDRNKSFASNSGFNMAGIGTLMEGRLDDGRGSWILSARQSFLEVVDKLLGMSTISLTAIPKYWDAQTKIVYDLSPNHKLTLNGLYGDSRIYIKGDPEDKNARRSGSSDSLSIGDVNVHSNQYVLGLNLKSLWGKQGYSILSLYAAGNMYNVDVQEKFIQRTFRPNGEVESHTTLNTRDIFKNQSDEEFVALKYEVFYQIHPLHDFSFGAQIQTSRLWKNKVDIAPDTMQYYNAAGGNWIGPIVSPSGSIVNTINFGDASKFFAYVSDRYKIVPRLNLTVGVRYDYFSFSEQGQISPRACLAYELVPPTTTLSLAGGEYWQTHPFPYYGDMKNLWYNKHMPNAKASHVVLGLQHILDDGIKLSIESFYKRYKNIAIEEQFIYSAIDTFRSDHNLVVGERESYGIEFFLQKKQVTNYYGTVSVTLSKTEDFDPRIPKQVNSYPSDYDYPVIITLVAGKITKGVRSWLDEQPFYIKYPSYILPLSDEMEVSFRYRYQTGRPYTPKIFVPTIQIREGGGLRWSEGAWRTSDRINSERFPDYSRLDLQWISRFYMQNWNINVYIALMNVFDTKNIFYYEYRSDRTKEPVYQFRFFPVGGIEIEF
jgi:hypothetical protein